MGCGRIRRELAAYVQGDLKVDRRDGIERHLEDCAGCRREAEMLRRSWSLLDAWTVGEPEPGYVSRFWKRMAAEAGTRPSASVRREFWPRLAGVLVLTCVVAIGYTALWRGLPRYTESLVRQEAEREFLENLDFFEDFDLIVNLDEIEALDILDEPVVPVGRG